MTIKPLSPEELALSYSKFYYMPVDPPDPAVQQILDNGPLREDQVTRIEDVDKLFEPGYQPCEYGFAVLSDGTAYQAFYTRMKGCTPEMIDWWFVWHFVSPPSVDSSKVGNLRYKIWNPYEHWDTGAATAEGRKLRCDSTQPLRGRACGIEDFIIESMDGTPMQFSAHSEPPSTLIKPEFMMDPSYGTAIVGVSDSGVQSLISLHFVRRIPGGVEMRTRLWYGYTVEDGKVIKRVNPNLTYEERLNMARGGFKHNSVECPHLGKFLPQLYAEEGWKDVDVY